MKEPLFEFPSYQYEIEDWQFKKKGILKRINSSKFIRTELQPFESDRRTSNKKYLHYIQDLLRSELNQFCMEAQVTCEMTDCWTVKYQKGDYQPIHNHRRWGFSGILCLEFDPKFHTPTYFVCPWQDPKTDTTQFVCPSTMKEGSLFLFPSYCLHYAAPNQARKERIIISFDLLPKTPKHQSINKDT